MSPRLDARQAQRTAAAAPAGAARAGTVADSVDAGGGACGAAMARV